MSRGIDRYGKIYTTLPFERRQAVFRREITTARICRYPHANILEVGCGLDPLASEFKDFKRLTVVEPFTKFADAARRLSRGDRGRKINVIEGFLENHVEALRKESFDFIVASGVLHEVPDPAAFLSSLVAVARSKTVTYVNVPNARSFHRLLAAEMKIIPDIYATSPTQKKLCQRLYDMESLQRAVTDAGFRVIDSGYYAFKPFTHAQMEKLMQQRFLNKRMLDGLFNMCKHAPELGSEMFVELKLPLRPRSSNKK